MTTSSPSLRIGFLTIVHEPTGYIGGYLVTNNWGRPVEFRLSTAIQPNRVQQILYGGTLQPYIYAELIGKTLVEKAGSKVQIVLTDLEPVLELRNVVDFPVAWLADQEEPLASVLAEAGAEVCAPNLGKGAVLCHPRFCADSMAIRKLIEDLDATLDLEEPFNRIREAIGEARKMGMTARG